MNVQKRLCLRCRHSWFPRGLSLAIQCPACHSPYWNKHRKPKTMSILPKSTSLPDKKQPQCERCTRFKIPRPYCQDCKTLQSTPVSSETQNVSQCTERGIVYSQTHPHPPGGLVQNSTPQLSIPTPAPAPQSSVAAAPQPVTVIELADACTLARQVFQQAEEEIQKVRIGEAFSLGVAGREGERLSGGGVTGQEGEVAEVGQLGVG